jgi:hypothetical protein
MPRNISKSRKKADLGIAVGSAAMALALDGWRLCISGDNVA